MITAIQVAQCDSFCLKASLKSNWEPGLENIKQRSPFNLTPDNPYLGMYEMLNKMNKHGVIGNISANAEP